MSVTTAQPKTMEQTEASARPQLLAELQHEIERDEPNIRLIARIVEKDIALSGAFLKLTNSARFQRARKAETVEAALAGLGLNEIALLASSFLVRGTLPALPQHLLDRFWEMSTRRSIAMGFLAQELRAGSADVARCFGLFVHLGVPLLMERFPDYAETLVQIENSPDQSFTQIEDLRHQTNHAVIGALLASNWRLPDDVIKAIAYHHDSSVFGSSSLAKSVKRLIALGAISDLVIRHYMGLPPGAAILQAATLAQDELDIGNDELEELIPVIHALFDQE
jgi:HD-like signal output (HDOD) protein